MTPTTQSPPTIENVVSIDSRPDPPRDGVDRRDQAVAAIVVAGIAASSLAGGLYDFSRWGLLAAALLAVLAGLLISGRVRSFGALTPAVLAVVGLAAWAALSMIWADSADRAWTESNRLILYAAAFAVIAGVLRTRGDVHRSLAIVGATIGIGALWAITALLVGEPGAFFDHRLDTPIGYINGTAGLFLMGIWPLVAVAERSDHPVLVGAAIGLAVIEMNLLVLTQSRAIGPALMISVLIAVALFPGRVRRIWTLLAVAAGTVVAAPWTLAVYADRVAGQPAPVPDDLARAAALAALGAAIVAGVMWSVVTLLRRRMNTPIARRVAAVGAAAVILLTVIAGVAASGDPFARVEREWRAFTTLQVDESARARFTGAGGFRYDLWRVAVADFRQHPTLGVGAGSYGLSYYQQRRQSEAVRQPHSLPLQILAELGIVGGVLMLIAAGAGLLALVRNRQGAVGAGVAGAGMASAWAVQTSVDWLYNLPGLTCIAIVGFVAASGCADRADRAPAPAARRRKVQLIAAAALIAIAAASLGRQYAAQSYARSAQRSLPDDPAKALASTTDSLALNPHATETYYTRAAAFARFDEYARARDALMQATVREPLNFVPWALLGDLAVRRGDMQAAREAYRQAVRLNPRDVGLAELAADPRRALG